MIKKKEKKSILLGIGSGKAQKHEMMHTTFKIVDFPGMGMRRIELCKSTESI